MKNPLSIPMSPSARIDPSMSRTLSKSCSASERASRRNSGEGDRAFAVTAPVLEEVDASGAGNSFVAALVSALLDGEELPQAARLAAAAGALNVTRHGLGTGDAEAIRRLREQVEVRELEEEAGFVTLDELAERTEVERP